MEKKDVTQLTEAEGKDDELFLSQADLLQGINELIEQIPMHCTYGGDFY